jgi:hypothetical protein
MPHAPSGSKRNKPTNQPTQTNQPTKPTNMLMLDNALLRKTEIP